MKSFGHVLRFDTASAHPYALSFRSGSPFYVMSAAIPFHKHTVGRTFLVAVSILGVGAALQIGAISWLFLTRYRQAPTPETAPTANNGASTAPPSRAFEDPFADSSTPAAANLNTIPAPVKPIPLPVMERTVSSTSESEERVAELIQQGRMLRERGDTYAAVTKLREAETMADENPQPTAELALTYEKMGFAEKAAESWKRVYEMGESAGVYYTAAEGKLKASQQDALKAATTIEGTPATSVPVPPGTGDKVGLNANCKLGLQDISRREETDAGAKKKFVLQVPVRAKSRARIDVHDVIVQVVFYDVVNGKALDRTGATVTYKWAAPPADWAEDDVETLEVTYLLPELRVSDEDRKYYGYVVSVYYKNALQDFRSDPVALGQRAAPPAALAQDPSQ